MLGVSHAHQFKKDWKRLRASGKNIAPVETVMRSIQKEEPLSPIYDDHPLHGRMDGHRCCHPQSDTALIYFVGHGKVTFERVGSHAELFDM
jgi:YafQ family addiction module toxin component